jgi:predicted nucleotidyltransferase
LYGWRICVIFEEKSMIALAQYKQELMRVLPINGAVKRLYLFGSALTPRFDKDKSDIDVLVETENLSPEEKGELLMVLWDDLEKLFSRKVDLLTEGSLRNPYLAKEIKQTRKLIYDGQSKQVFI